MSAVVLTAGLFGGVSLIAGTVNLAFLIRAYRNYVAAVKLSIGDHSLRRIGGGFLYVWIIVVLADMVRFVVGAGILLNQPQAGYLLLLTPVLSLVVGVIGLISFR